MHHLTERFSDQKMIVYDEKRNCAMLYNLQERVIIPFTKEDAAHILADCQDDTIDLFRRYFQTINIPERENLRQQAGYMPHRYRHYMPETE
jgi:probable DNA metabolism protein